MPFYLATFNEGSPVDAVTATSGSPRAENDALVLPPPPPDFHAVVPTPRSFSPTSAGR